VIEIDAVSMIGPTGNGLKPKPPAATVLAEIARWYREGLTVYSGARGREDVGRILAAGKPVHSDEPDARAVGGHDRARIEPRRALRCNRNMRRRRCKVILL
jgi:hypothetical protein